jgi:hypothetical protein
MNQEYRDRTAAALYESMELYKKVSDPNRKTELRLHIDKLQTFLATNEFESDDWLKNPRLV